jgi:hypothetical protein
VIDDLNFRIERIKEQIHSIKGKNDLVLLDLDEKNYHEVEEVQKKYE